VEDGFEVLPYCAEIRVSNQSHRMRRPWLPRLRSSQMRISATVRSSPTRIHSRNNAALESPRLRAMAPQSIMSFSASRTLKAFTRITCASGIRSVKCPAVARLNRLGCSASLTGFVISRRATLACYAFTETVALRTPTGKNDQTPPSCAKPMRLGAASSNGHLAAGSAGDPFPRAGNSQRLQLEPLD